MKLGMAGFAFIKIQRPKGCMTSFEHKVVQALGSHHICHQFGGDDKVVKLLTDFCSVAALKVHLKAAGISAN